jgi:hypothetical protein
MEAKLRVLSIKEVAADQREVRRCEPYRAEVRVADHHGSDDQIQLAGFGVLENVSGRDCADGVCEGGGSYEITAVRLSSARFQAAKT